MGIIISGNTISNNFNTSGEITNTPEVVTNGLVLWVDAGNNFSYINSPNYYDCGYGPQYYSSDPGCPACNSQWKDLSGYGNDGSINGSIVQYSSSGGAMYFDKIDDYVHFGNSNRLPITTQISVFSWINLNNIGEWNGIFGTFSGGGFIHFQCSYSNLNIYIYGPGTAWGAIDSGGLTTGTWINVGFTFDGTTMKVYKNGIQFPSTATASAPNSQITTGEFSIGRVYEIARSFGGLIATTLVYNKSLTQVEITQNFNNGRQRFGI